jgi:predicted Zn-dependent protease
MKRKTQIPGSDLSERSGHLPSRLSIGGKRFFGRVLPAVMAVSLFASAAWAKRVVESSKEGQDEEVFTAEGLARIYGLYIDAFLAGHAGDATRELEILRDLAGRRPDSGYVRARMAEVLLAEDRTEEGLKEAQRAVELAPDEFETHQVLGQAYFQSSDIVRAATEFQLALELHPYDYTSLLYLGEIHEMAGEFLEAATVNMRLAYLRPNHAWQHQYKAAVNFMRGGELERGVDMLPPRPPAPAGHAGTGAPGESGSP